MNTMVGAKVLAKNDRVHSFHSGRNLFVGGASKAKNKSVPAFPSCVCRRQWKKPQTVASSPGRNRLIVEAIGQCNRNMHSRVGAVHGELISELGLKTINERGPARAVNLSHLPDVSSEMAERHKIGEHLLVQVRRKNVHGKPH